MLVFCLAMINNEDDKKSFEKLYGQYYRLAFSVAFNILKNNALAEDSCSEAFLSIAKCFEKLRIQNLTNRRRYIVITVKNTSINMYNKEKKRAETVSLDDDFSESEWITAPHSITEIK